MNRLSDSSSLYLRQHADNPVDWHPWDDDALELARGEDRPVLLSIGYSACHWCHVMAHESFGDPATAELMNSLFVNIKVDREERPDLDKVYQLSHQLLTGRGGGWPLTVFLEPHDLGAFFAGTYFPPQARHGLPAFRDLLCKVREWFDANRGAVTAQNRNLQQTIQATQEAGPDPGSADAGLVDQAYAQLQARHDPHHGGFGGAPKFPQAPLLGLAASLARMDSDFAGDARRMLDASLAAMAVSGLRDHLDGGFFRYSVDAAWTIPHFEKMLYDNAQLLPLYAEAARRSGDDLLRATADGIAGWLLTEMKQPAGGFAASIDADADGQEGGYHVWDREAVRSVLEADQFEAFARDFGLDQAPNFEGRHWHLQRANGSVSGHEAALERLRAARCKRVAPATDSKILTAWNALCIDGLARAGAALNRPEWLEAAVETLEFLRRTAWREHQLYAVIYAGEARVPGYLDDHAFLLQATLSVLQQRWQDDLLPFARALADRLLSEFAHADGGFYFTASSQPVPVARLRLLQDDATPNGNAVAAMALQSLAHLDARHDYAEAARKALNCGAAELARYPLAHASQLTALNHQLRPFAQVIIGGADEHEKHAWHALAARFDRVNCYVVPAGARALPGAAGRELEAQAVAATVCLGMRCLPTVTRPEALEQALREA
jgi:hypothetical protein